MDNIDGIIKTALEETRAKPDEELIYKTVVLMNNCKSKDNRTVLNIIFVYNIALILLAAALACFIAPESRFLIYFLCLSWFSTIYPVFIIAKDSFLRR